MSRFSRRAFLVRGGGAIAAVAASGRWSLVGEARGGTDPRLAALARAVKGPVITPASAAYAQARLVYNERFDGIHPLGVFRPASLGDIRQAVAWADKTRVQLAIRSGGHSYAGYSTTTGLVVDLRQFAAIHVDRPSGTVTVGAGARLVDLEAALAQRGLAVPTGSCATVGAGGLALGGGVGLASRAFGTTSDNIVSVGIVTADGRYRIASASQNPDLFWACRGGGGGNFGIVTQFVFRTHPVGDVSYFFADWDWSQAREAVRAWQEFAPHAPDGLFSICALRTGSPGPSLQAFGQFLGSETRLNTILRPLARVPGVKLTLGSSAYLDAQLRWAGCLGKTVAQCHLAGESPGGTLQRSAFAASRTTSTRRSLERGCRHDHALDRASPGGRARGLASPRLTRRSDQPRTRRRDRVRAPELPQLGSVLQFLDAAGQRRADPRLDARLLRRDAPVRLGLRLPELHRPRPHDLAARLLRRELRAASAREEAGRSGWAVPLRPRNQARLEDTSAYRAVGAHDGVGERCDHSVGERHECLDLDGETARQLGDPNRAARADAAFLAPELGDRVREPVCDGGLIAKTRSRANEDQHLEPPLDAIERPELFAQASAHEVGGRSRCEGCPVEVDVSSDAAEAAEVSVTGEVGETPVDHDRLEARLEGRAQWRRQLDAELFQACFGDTASLQPDQAR